MLQLFVINHRSEPHGVPPHRCLQTAMIYTHVLQATRSVTSPFDSLWRRQGPTGDRFRVQSRRTASGRLPELMNGCFVEAKHENVVAERRTASEKLDRRVWVDCRQQTTKTRWPLRAGSGHSNGQKSDRVERRLSPGEADRHRREPPDFSSARTVVCSMGAQRRVLARKQPAMKACMALASTAPAAGVQIGALAGSQRS
jgi:hypothetical protein